MESIKAPEPIEKGKGSHGGCPHFSAGRCQILNQDVDELNKAAEKYDDSGESEADEDL